MEFKLATIEAAPVSTDDPVIAKHADALDALQKKCKERRELLSDFSVKADELLNDSGIDESLLTILRNVNKSIPGSAPKMPCSDIFAAYVTLRRG